MESKNWSGFGYFSSDSEKKIKQLLVCSKHQNTWEDTENVVKAFFSIQSKKKNVRQWKKTEFSTPFVVKSYHQLVIELTKNFPKRHEISFVAKLEDLKTLKQRTMNPGNWSFSPVANYASWSHVQIKRWRNLTVLKFQADAKIETKIRHDTICPLILSR